MQNFVEFLTIIGGRGGCRVKNEHESSGWAGGIFSDPELTNALYKSVQNGSRFSEHDDAGNYGRMQTGRKLKIWSQRIRFVNARPHMEVPGDDRTGSAEV